MRAASASVSRRDRSFMRSTMAFRSEEHTSELQSQSNLVCRLLLENKILRSDRINADLLAPVIKDLEGHHARDHRIEREIAAHADVAAGAESGSQLNDHDLARNRVP